MQENMEKLQEQFLGKELLQSAASSSSSEVVYAYDGQRNEVAVGLIFEGNFQRQTNEEIGEDENVNVTEDEADFRMDWVAAEEECGTVPVDLPQSITCQKVECIQFEGNAEKKKSKHIRVYKSKARKNKQLMSLKRQLESVKRKLKSQEVERRKLSKSLHNKSAKVRNGKPVKRRAFKTDIA